MPALNGVGREALPLMEDLGDMSRIFILSPARTTGKRAALLWNERAQFETARRLRTSEGIPVGEAFAFLSGLYFRGKLAYARHFAAVRPGLHGAYVITSNAGLVPVDEPVTLERLRCYDAIEAEPAGAAAART